MAIISGIGIQNNEENDKNNEEYLDSLLRAVNEQNKKMIEKQDEIQQAEALAAEEADRLAREEARSATLKARAEEERLERERIAKEEADEEQARQEEALRRQQSMPWVKVAKVFRKKEKPKTQQEKEPGNIVPDTTPDTEEPAASETKEVAEIQEVAETEATTEMQEAPPEVVEEKVERCVTEKSSSPAETVEVKETDTSATSNEPKIEDTPSNAQKPEKKFLFGILQSGTDSAKKQKNPKKTKPTKKESPETKPELDFEYLATHDEKTGIKNGTGFKLDLEKLPAGKLAMIYFDVDNLKVTNDTLGHVYGDKLIAFTAETLDKLFPGNAYRTGGDEFMVLLNGIGPKVIDKKLSEFDRLMAEQTKKDEDGVKYRASYGYKVNDGSLSKQELQDFADKEMYKRKQATKEKEKKAQKTDGTSAKKSPAGKPETSPQKPEKQIPYDERLPREARELKNIIRETHREANEESTERILYEIQKRHQEIYAILIASPTFDHLFIIQDVRHFLNLCVEMDGLMDYSYLYVCYDGGPQYYGSDDYYNEVTHLFESIAEMLKYNRSITDKELLKIKGINIFKEIYLG